MKPTIRNAVTSDATTVVELIREYSVEVFQQESGVTAEALLNDGFGSVFEFIVAELPSGELAGFAAWEKTYDIAAGARGGALLGLYVRPEARGSGVGDLLLAAVMREVRSIGGGFVVGIADEPTELTESHRPSLRVPRIQTGPLRHDAADLAATLASRPPKA